jgi:outer membrane protein assembly factor BamE (lipoprotein component of BamABCDE complex)
VSVILVEYMRRKKVFITTLVVLISVSAAELIREEVVYLSASRKLESACQRIEAGMTREQVGLLAGEPDSATAAILGKAWHWNTIRYRGVLWKSLGLTAVKGHYELTAAFDEDGKVTRTWCGVN